MHISENTSSPSSKPLAMIEFPSVSTPPSPPDFGATEDGGSENFGDFSALDCAEQIQKQSVRKPSNLDYIRDHVRRSTCTEDIAPTLPSREKKMPPRSKSESANAILRRFPALSASSRSAMMRKNKTDATKTATTSAAETGRPRVRRDNSKRSISSSFMDSTTTSSRPRVRRENSKSSIGLGDSSRPRVRRENSRSSVKTSKRSSGRSISPTPGPVRQSNNGERRRKTRSTRQQEQLNKSLSTFLDAQETFNESFRCLDMAKSCHSKISCTESFGSHDSGHSKRSQKSEKPEDSIEFSDSFFSEDSHPSLTGSTSVPCGDTWTCTCGTVMKNKMRFCGMCGNGKHWTCSDCDFDENLCQYVYCGMCGANKKRCAK